MKLFSHFAATGFSNTYLIGSEEGGDAILVDPDILDVNLFELIENNKYYIRWILVTQEQEGHTPGIRTLLKIYDAMVYSRVSSVGPFPSVVVGDAESIKLGPFSVEGMVIPGHGHDSILYRIDRLLFTGKILPTGGIGETVSVYARRRLIDSIKEKIFSRFDDLTLLPAEGPPSTLQAERLLNPVLKETLKSY